MSNSIKYLKQIVRPRFFSSGKKLLSFLLLLSAFCGASSQTSYLWTPHWFGGSARYGAVSFSIGTKGYLGTGWSYGWGYHSDFWEYDPSNDTWTQKADVGGYERAFATGFSIGNKGYIGMGNNNTNNWMDFWEYDPSSNTWLQRANFGGGNRSYATGFSIGNKGYVGTGLSISQTYDYRKDFWEFDPAVNTWTQKADFGGTGRIMATGFSIGSNGYIGTGWLYDGNNHFYNDFWEYDPSADAWIQKANVGGPARYGAVGFSIGTKGYIGTGYYAFTDFHEYDPATDAWTQKPNCTDHGTYNATGFSIGNKGYIGTGQLNGNLYNDFWEYAPCTPPHAESNPSPATRCEGESVIFSADFLGTIPALTYQWRKDGIDIPGATNTTYINYSVAPSDAGDYDLVATNVCDSAAATNSATLTVHSTGTWLGTFSTDWSDAGNWCGGGVPSATTNVTIISDAPFQPELSSGDEYANNIVVNNGASLTVSGSTLHVNGNISNEGTITNSSGTFLFEGTTLQTISGLTLRNAEINNTGGINITGDLVINGSLSLTHGTITTDAHKVIITSAATLSRTEGWVNGNLQKYIPADASITKSFEIGDASSYTPIDLVIHGAEETNVTAYTTAGDHPLIASSAINPSKSVNRVWQISGLQTFTSLDATFNFVAGDIDYGVNPNRFSVAQYDGTSWTIMNTGTKTATSTQAVNITSEGEFIVGKENCTPPVLISNPSSATKCADDAVTFSSDFSGPDLIYQWRKNTVPISEATNSSYTISSVTTDDAGSYDVVATNDCDIDSTNSAMLIVHATGTWLGTNSFEWNDAGNWCGGVPVATTNVTITSDTPFQPELSSGDGYANNITVGNGASLTVSGSTLHLDGNIINDGAITHSGGTLSFEGTSLQTLPSLELQNIGVNNIAGISITGDLTINGSLTLTQGTITTDTNKVIITSTATISRTGGWVNGNLQKYIPDGASVSKSFEIGDAARYTPINLDIHGAIATDVTAYTIVGDHPLIASSAIDPAKSVNRVWHLSGLVNFSSFDATFNFNETDLDAGANPNNFIIAKYDDTSWTTLTTGTRTATSTQAVNVTSECSFIVGEVNLTPATDVWIQRSNFGGMARIDAAGFSIGAKGYIGTGNSAGGLYKDFWEYDPSTNAWTQKADFGGAERYGAVGFSIGTKGYIGTGVSYGSLTSDFWEYDPSANTWTQKADFAGAGRFYAVGFSIGTKGYIGTGFPALKDFWEYDPATDTWTQKSDFGGSPRRQATGFSIGTKGYIGTGFSYFYGARNDFWEYDPSTDIWTQKNDFAGAGRVFATSFSTGTKGYLGIGYTYPSGYLNDFWEYDPSSDTWMQKANFGGTARSEAIGFSIGGKGYIGTGYDGAFQKDFWEYTPTCTQHTFYADADGDGYGSTATVILCSSIAPTGYSANNTDCNDNDATVHTSQSFYVDADQDSYGSTATAMLCSSIAPTGYSTNSTDCNDNDATAHTPQQYFVDADHDSYGSTATAMLCSSTAPTGYSTNSTDCNDNDSTVHVPQSYYVDADQDSYGSSATAMLCSSVAPAGYSTNNTDCNDNNTTVNPGAADICNAIDDNCNGVVDENAITATIAQGADVFVCTGTTVVFAANTGSGLKYQWIKNGRNILGASQSTYSTKKSASYQVKETNSFGCSATSAITSLTQADKPIATITSQGSLNLCGNNSVVLEANPGSGLLYQWQKNAGYIAGATNQTYTATIKGNYKCIVSNSTGCSAISNTLKVTKSCREGTDEMVTTSLNIYPNPATGSFNMELNLGDDVSVEADVQIMNQLGQSVFFDHVEIVNGKLHEVIRLDQSVSGGIYLLRIIAGTKVYTGEVVYQK